MFQSMFSSNVFKYICLLLVIIKKYLGKLLETALYHTCAEEYKLSFPLSYHTCTYHASAGKQSILILFGKSLIIIRKSLMLT